MRMLQHGSAPLIAAVLLSTAILAIGPAPASAAGLRQVSADPYTYSFFNVSLQTEHHTAVEPHAAANGNTMVATFQVGRSFNGGASNTGWATTTDGGVTWTRGVLPRITKAAGGPYDRVSDPMVAYDVRASRWLIASLAVDLLAKIPVGVALVVNSSPDGLHWSGPTTVVPRLTVDKEWLACDNTPTSPFYGHCYIEWHDYGALNNGLIQMSTSLAGGINWGPPQTTANNAQGIGGQVLVAPNGAVVVPIDTNGFTGVQVFTSTDGGATWGGAQILTLIGAKNNLGLRAESLISAAMDQNGATYMVWSDCELENHCANQLNANGLVLMTRTLAGVTSGEMRIPLSDPAQRTDYFVPSISIDPSTPPGTPAHIGVTYYYYPTSDCTLATCRLKVGFVSSVDGGQTWSAPLQLAGPMPLNALANTNQGRMFGDYLGAPFMNGRAYPIFAEGTAPGGIFDQAFAQDMYTVIGGLDPAALAAGATTPIGPAAPALNSPPAPSIPASASVLL